MRPTTKPARIIAEAFAQLEDRYPQLKDVATQTALHETELRLQRDIAEIYAKLEKEIREVEARLQLEIKEVEAKLRQEIHEVEARLRKEMNEIDARLRKEMKELDTRLQTEIKTLDLKIQALQVELAQVEVRLTQAIHRQTLWVIGAVGFIISAIRLLEWLLAHLP